MSRAEHDTGRPVRKFSPSTEKAVPEEADGLQARQNADLFVERLYHQMDTSEHGPNALVPTSQDITVSYEQLKANVYWQYKPEALFVLREAYGAAKRKLLFQKELAAEWGERGTSRLAMQNIGNMYLLMTAIELALPEDQRLPRGNI